MVNDGIATPGKGQRIVWIINQNSYLPDDGPHTRHYSIGKYLARDGYLPIVFAGNELHHSGRTIDTGGEDFVVRELNGVRFIYVRTHHYERNDIHRVANIASFYFRMFKVARAIAGECGNPCVIYASTMYPTALLLGVKLARRYGIGCISETRDIVPEGFIREGAIRENSLVARAARRFMRYVYERSDELVFTMSGGKRYIQDMAWDKESGGKIDLSHVHYINNGVDLEDFDANAKTHVLEDEDLDNQNVFKVVYFGAIRFMNSMPLYIDTARELKRRGRDDICILLWGTGTKLDEMQEVLDREGLDNIKIKGYVDKKYIPSIARRADLFIASGNSSSTGRYGASFNKLFDYFAGGKPIVLLAELSDSMVEGGGCGVELGADPEAAVVADEIIRFADMDPNEYRSYCEASASLAKQFDYRRLAERIKSIIERLTCG